MIDPLILLRKAKVKTTLGEVEIEEFTFLRELLFQKIDKEDITAQVSFICPDCKNVHLLTQGDKENILTAAVYVNSPLPIPQLPPGDNKKVDSNFFDCLLLLCKNNIGSLKEIITSYSIQQINEFAYAIQDNHLRFNSSDSNQSIEEKMKNAIEGTGRR